MDINKRLNKIIFDHNIDAVYPAYKEYVRAQELIDRKIFEWGGRSSGKVLCICNSHSNRIYFENRIPDSSMQIDFLVLQRGEFGSTDNDEIISKIHEIKSRDYDEICVVAYNGMAVIGYYLRREQIEYSWLYDYFGINGLYIDREWHDFLHDETGLISYNPEKRLCFKRTQEIIEYYDLGQRLKHLTGNDQYELSCLLYRRRVFVALFIHNFVDAYKMIDEYVALSGDRTYADAKREIYKLFDDIKETLAKRSKRDIIIHWIDKVPYRDLKYADFLYNDVRVRSIFFTRMFTMSPYTVPSFVQMFGGRRPVDDGGWAEWFSGGKSISDWEVIHDIESSGYRFISYCRDFRNFPREYIPVESIDSYACSSDLLWHSVNCMISHDDPMVIFAHLCLETHEPFWSNNMTDADISDSDARYIKGIQAVDEQLHFYSELYNKELTSIYLSDHGKEDFQSRFHCFLAIDRKYDIASKMYDGLCCWLDFGKILVSIMNNEELPYEELDRQYVQLQEFNWLDGHAQVSPIRNKGDISWFVNGFRGAISKEGYIYLRFSTGVEWVKKYDEAAFMLEPTWFQREDDIDQISTEGLEGLRKAAGKTQCEDLDKFYKYNKYTQQIFKRALPHEIEKIRLLNELIDGVGNEKLYLRMGGFHSYRLYAALTVTNRKKIKAIIDNNPECRCKKLGIPIIRDIPNEGVIILSSFDSIEILRDEAKSYNGVNVIDIYEYLKKCGYNCRFPVYNFEPNPEEYEVGFPFEDFE